MNGKMQLAPKFDIKLLLKTLLHDEATVKIQDIMLLSTLYESSTLALRQLELQFLLPDKYRILFIWSQFLSSNVSSTKLIGCRFKRRHQNGMSCLKSICNHFVPGKFTALKRFSQDFFSLKINFINMGI